MDSVTRSGADEALLEVCDLRTYFRTRAGTARAVDGVCLSVGRGETLGLVGESGCGKTVTALSVMALVPSPAGEILPGSSIRFEGEELVGAAEARLRRMRGNEVSMIFQEPMTSLNPVYSVGSQVVEALRLHRGLRGHEATAAAVELFAEVRLPDPEVRLGEYPHQLSGGMRQRVMIAMALSCEPQLLIADEPTTALDVTTQAQILDLLSDIRRRRSMAVLLISHDLGVIAGFCDRVAVMYAGQIVEEGTVEEVLHHPSHPYTQGLLASLPGRHVRGTPLAVIPGVVPSPSRWPHGCRFHERCALVMDRCRKHAPDLLPDAGSGRSTRCWLRSPESATAEETRA
jgi:peptide/nickel transport system ATP-binding protein